MESIRQKEKSGNSYKLSIIIPTYNGGEWIASGIKSIVEQVKNIPEVEFLIRDNASTDNTRDVVLNLQNEYPNVIRYDRREKNTPFLDENFKEAIELTSGEYFILIGDDDAFMPGAIFALLDLIKNNPDISLFYLNRLVARYDYTEAYLRNTKSIDPVNNKIYEGVVDFLCANINGPDFITVNVIKRSIYDLSESIDTQKYYGYEWYARYLFSIKRTLIMGVNAPLVIQRLPKIRSWGKLSVLYALVGLSNLLKDIDETNVVYGVWMRYIHSRGRIYITLSGLTKNKVLYKKKYSEITVHLNSMEKMISWLLLYFPPFKYVYSAILMTLKKINLI